MNCYPCDISTAPEVQAVVLVCLAGACVVAAFTLVCLSVDYIMSIRERRLRILNEDRRG